MAGLGGRRRARGAGCGSARSRTRSAGRRRSRRGGGEVRRAPGDDRQAGVRGAGPWASSRAARGCRACGAGGRRRASSRSRRSGPAYMTTMRDVRVATTPRSWVIEDRPTCAGARAGRRAGSRIWAWMVTSSAGRRLVGHQQLGRAGQRGGDDDALAHAARELVRVGAVALARGEGMPTDLEQLDRPGPGAPPRSIPRRTRSASSIWRPTRITGLSEVIGSWKTIATSVPQYLALLGLAGARPPGGR